MHQGRAPDGLPLASGVFWAAACRAHQTRRADPLALLGGEKPVAAWGSLGPARGRPVGAIHRDPHLSRRPTRPRTAGRLTILAALPRPLRPPPPDTSRKMLQIDWRASEAARRRRDTHLGWRGVVRRGNLRRLQHRLADTMAMAGSRADTVVPVPGFSPRFRPGFRTRQRPEPGSESDGWPGHRHVDIDESRSFTAVSRLSVWLAVWRAVRLLDPRVGARPRKAGVAQARSYP